MISSICGPSDSRLRDSFQILAKAELNSCSLPSVGKQRHAFAQMIECFALHINESIEAAFKGEPFGHIFIEVCDAAIGALLTNHMQCPAIW